ncbi:hypothetical protein [Clostridium felsineum]|uniref:Uncharacterized protein n=2 Tax=Clostridium felsineum TaxID=36839 RepID=A0A1S8LHK3_9CLOT|nr:hypothetical protein [Clostridium felsineum]MCR3761909.1 hypothetical protein [Clostridium felsineum]URZ01316.1 hypothetical protein CLAUR_013060 [Clostridium felsineum]URZ05849.1 hypothetical protein CLROS_011800 [Clostridium felsineum]URZ10886.1 hypothetical protein CROST_016010 [Clostridium felsineum]
MEIVGLIYFMIIIGMIILAIITYLVFDKRYHKNHGKQIPAGFEKTEEITIDPSDGRKLRVYYNKQTGERFYFEENL